MAILNLQVHESLLDQNSGPFPEPVLKAKQIIESRFGNSVEFVFYETNRKQIESLLRSDFGGNKPMAKMVTKWLVGKSRYDIW